MDYSVIISIGNHVNYVPNRHRGIEAVHLQLVYRRQEDLLTSSMKHSTQVIRLPSLITHKTSQILQPQKAQQHVSGQCSTCLDHLFNQGVEELTARMFSWLFSFNRLQTTGEE